MIRYGFNIRTKHGQRVENILIMAATQDDAERRLRQMYHHCEIVDCQEHSVPRRLDTLDVDRRDQPDQRRRPRQRKRPAPSSSSYSAA